MAITITWTPDGEPTKTMLINDDAQASLESMRAARSAMMAPGTGLPDILSMIRDDLTKSTFIPAMNQSPPASIAAASAAAASAQQALSALQAEFIAAAMAPLAVSTKSLPGGTTGAAYSEKLAATGGSNAGYAWTVSAGSLPGGLSLASDGTISGTPTASGTFSFTATVTDSFNNTASQQLSLAIS